MTERTGIFFGDQKSIKRGTLEINSVTTGDKVEVEYLSKQDGKEAPAGTIYG